MEAARKETRSLSAARPQDWPDGTLMTSDESVTLNRATVQFARFQKVGDFQRARNPCSLMKVLRVFVFCDLRWGFAPYDL